MSFTVVKVTEFRPNKGKVFVTDLEHGEKLSRGGIIIRDDNMSDKGIRPRWGKVWAVGPDIEDVTVGEWILLEHGRWTPRIHLEVAGEPVDVWSVDFPAAVLLVSDVAPKLV